LTKRNTLIVVVGPTAVGKTAAAIRLARMLDTEVISADSRQMYREMNIGTAKPTATELAAVRHHFIDTLSVGEPYDAARFEQEGLVLLEKIFEHHAWAVLAGGSGLYVQALCKGFDDIPEVDEEVRIEVRKNYEEQGLSWLQAEVRLHDPEFFARVDQQNPHRLLRALEVFLTTGQSILSFQGKNVAERPFDIVKIGLELPREELYERIDARMDSMIAQGLFDEARSLYPYKNFQALQTVGYQEIFGFLDGAYDEQEAIRLLKRNYRRYAKRQLTWFKRDSDTVWFDPRNFGAIEAYVGERAEI